MAVCINVLYPVGPDTTFDHEYYQNSHLPLVNTHWGAHIDQVIGTRGQSGGTDTPPPYHAIATIVFADQAAMNAAMDNAKPVMADVRNFTNVKPQMLIGDTYG